MLLGNDLKILIVTPHFYPENFRINDFAMEFQKKGHEITVLTAIPDYPEGKFYDGYGLFKKNREIYNGIKIYRAPLIPRGSGSNIRLALNYISFVIGAIFTSLFMMKNEFDIVFCNHVLEHIPDDTKAMQELYRVLAPSGTAIVQVPYDVKRTITFEDNTITDQSERTRIFGQYDHLRVYGMDYFKKLSSIGFEVNALDYTSGMSSDDIERYRLCKGELLPVCKK